ncbi:MAG: hypothetical protein NC432_04820 [Roseburia sp.]|nr:hypothetical protein [Roseburia sp.]MCM1098630.1 hypothetical protein [Ruminococcus flavefaciens]
MKKDESFSEQEMPQRKIPDIEVIDFEENIDSPEIDEAPDPSGEAPKKRFRINLHIVLAITIVLVPCIILLRFLNWGKFISQNEIRDNIEGGYSDTLDLTVPLVGDDGRMIPLNTEDGLSIVFFGNAPFADDRDSKDNLVNIIGDLTGATVYNCSIGDSYMACERSTFRAEEKPMDAYSLFWMAASATGAAEPSMFQEAASALGENIPEDAQQATDLLGTIDFSTVDVIAIMYDAYDYLLGRPVINLGDATDLTTFTGNLESAIWYLQFAFPHIRIIVLSPTYAFSDELDENGNYVSSGMVRYNGYDALSSYVVMEGSSCSLRQVTFIDNLYGTVHEDNALDYLSDNRHLNIDGRKLVARRFIEAMNCYNSED